MRQWGGGQGTVQRLSSSETQAQSAAVQAALAAMLEKNREAFEAIEAGESPAAVMQHRNRPCHLGLSGLDGRSLLLVCDRLCDQPIHSFLESDLLRKAICQPSRGV
jgi:hypothetical protein